jgi:hypothetical protein
MVLSVTPGFGGFALQPADGPVACDDVGAGRAVVEVLAVDREVPLPAHAAASKTIATARTA